MECTGEQLKALRVLAYLMLRMGRLESAHRIYAGLAALAPQDRPDIMALAGLAAVEAARGDGSSALEHIGKALEKPVPTSCAPFYLIKAQALWLVGRKVEAKAACNTYISMNNGGAL